MKREKRRRREWERWRGERVDSEEWQARARGRPMPVLSVWCLKVRSTGSETGLLTRNICCFDFTFTSFSSSLSVVALRCSHSAPHPLSPRLPTSFSFHPPILHQLIWHIPALIVQAEPLALFKICIRMLFLYSSKRRHVESLLNCSANRWRFSRCLYEIKWNIPIKKKKKKAIPCVPSPSTVSLSPCLSFLFYFCLFLYCLFCFLFFLARLRHGQGHGAAESAVESRQVCVTNNYFPRRASTKHLPEFRANRSCECDTAGAGREFLFLVCSVNLFNSDSGRLVPSAPLPSGF